MIKRIYYFIRYNEKRRLTLAIYALTAYCRICMLFVPPEKLQKHWGKAGEESKPVETQANYQYCARVGKHVNHIANKTTWESKCLVKALTARKLLMRKGISCTLYLGVGKDENQKMIAHAWLRSGECFVTGGNGSGYSIVAKYAS